MNIALMNPEETALYHKMDYLKKFPIFHDPHDWVEIENVAARPLRPQTFQHLNFETTTEGNKFNYTAFTMNRTLSALYEQDFLYLPPSDDNVLETLRQGYNAPLRAAAHSLIDDLAKKTLGFVEDQIYVSENWDEESFIHYIKEKICTANSGTPPSFAVIRNAEDPALMAKMLLIQHAVDFLPESSHMARYAKGDYGEIQSALFRIIIDEYGYGSHERKHNILFKNTLESVGMANNSHAYWMFYMNSTLLLNNYFHKITKYPEHVFEYFGAITFAENTFSTYCAETKKLLNECFGDVVDTRYYSEHVHIDDHHGRMTLDELLIPVIRKYGAVVIPDIIRGIETTARLQEIVEEDFHEQMVWMSKAGEYRKLAHHIRDRAEANIENMPVAYLNEPRGELSVTHCHDGDELCIVDEGVLRFCHGFDCFSDLGAGDCVVIKKNRLHGAIVLDENCTYRILSIGEYTKYADYQI